MTLPLRDSLAASTAPQAPATDWIARLARPEIVELAAYESAAWDPLMTRLHANELPWRADGDDTAVGLNRYPQPRPRELEERLAALYGVPPESVLAGRGSDEAIDLLMRGFCRAGRDAVLICPPTFGMYALAARIQGARVVQVPLRAAQGFALDRDAVLAGCLSEVKLVFLCSPNNPTGNRLDSRAVLELADALAGRALVVVDEAYVEFAAHESLAALVAARPQLVVLRTLSKAFGLAGARCGAMIAAPQVVALLHRVIPPYAIGQHTIETVRRVLQPQHLARIRERIAGLVAARDALAAALTALPRVLRVHPSEANFLLARFTDAGEALALAQECGLLVRDARGYAGLDDALRITVGSDTDNARLIEAWS